MKQKILDIINEPIEDLANLKADQIMELFKIELETVYNLPEDEKHFMFETFYRMCYATEQN